MKKFVISLALAAAASVAWALPTVQQVESEVQQGHTERAEGMMSEVVAAKPDSARAHFVYAEILARNGKFSKAAEEEARARQIDPDAKFAQPERVQAFEQLLDRQQRAATRTSQTPAFGSAAAPLATPRPTGGIPGWVWLVALAAIAYVLWRGFSRSRSASLPSAGMAGANGAPLYPGSGPMNPGGAYGPAMPGAGSGLLGTGMAVAGGVAGGMLLDELLHHRSASGLGQAGGEAFGSGGSQGNDAASELETRQVDFGNGNDWDSGASSGDVGGGMDGGSWDS